MRVTVNGNGVSHVTHEIERASETQLEWLASQLASGRTLTVSMQLNAGPILNAGEHTGFYGVWAHDGTGALKLKTEYAYRAARELCSRAGLAP